MLKVSCVACFGSLPCKQHLGAASLLLRPAKSGLQLEGGLLPKSCCLVSLTGEIQEQQSNVPCGFWTRGVVVLTHLMLHISVCVAALELAEAWQ